LLTMFVAFNLMISRVSAFQPEMQPKFGAVISNFDFNNVWIGPKMLADTSENFEIEMPYLAARVLQDGNTWRINTSIIPFTIAMGSHFSGDGKNIPIWYDIVTLSPLWFYNGSINYKLNQYLAIGLKNEFDPFFFSNSIEPYWSSGLNAKIKLNHFILEVDGMYQWLDSYNTKKGIFFNFGIYMM